MNNGYKIKIREDNSNQFSGDKCIYWWKTNDRIKCDGYSPLGYYAQGSANNLEEAIDEIFIWFVILDKDDEKNCVTVKDMKDALKDLNEDLKIKIKTDCGVLCIDSIDDTDSDIIYINTE